MLKDVQIVLLESKHLNNDYSRTNAMDFKTEYEKNGGRIIAIENGDQGDKDFMQQLKRIKALKPEAANFDDVTKFYDGTYNWGTKPDSYSFRAYDAANIILNAIRGAATKDKDGNLHIDRDKICSIVAATRDYNGVSGKITFTPNGDRASDTGIFSAENRRYLQMKVYRLNGDNLMRVK